VRCLVTDKNPKTVKMIADLGKGDPFDAGHCHPSQARILVKKKLAEWRDGKLLVMLRPVHIAVAMNTLTLPGEGRDVSEAEVKRRQSWFQEVVRAVADSDTHGSDIARIFGYHLGEGMRAVGPRDTIALIQAEAIKRQEEIKDRLVWLKENADPEDDESTDNSWYDPDAEPPASVDEGELAALWGGTHREISPEVLETRFGIVMTEAGEAPHHPNLPVYTPEDVGLDENGNPGILLIPLPYAGKISTEGETGRLGNVGSRSDDLRKRDGTFGQKDITRKCPTCGQGEDTDGDGNCPACKTFLKIPVAR
jgi:hypothetical protein